MTYAFTFDASSCSGCKACQAACKDKNQLPVGVLWRRVYEVNGGEWEQNGAAWTNTVFAYNLSMSCNHCEHPKCAGVCPVNAYVVREDGIVYIDETKCVGCGYCAWACPYGAPQYNPELGHMTKCNFCFDNIDSGNPPACVAACPLRTLNYVDADHVSRKATEKNPFIPLWQIHAREHPFPMFPMSRTGPHIAIKPHKAMQLDLEKKIANYEEIHPRKESAWDEIPLVIFTLLAQMSVGAFWFASLLFPKPLTIIPLSIIGLSLGLGMFFSFAHLGTKKNAWRVLNHLKKSWLSREILTASLFGAGWLAVTAASLIFKISTPLLSLMTAALGFALIYSMGRVYRLGAKPKWYTWQTTASFFASALLLGLLSMSSILIFELRTTGTQPPNVQWKIIGVLALGFLMAQWLLTRHYKSDKNIRALSAGLSIVAAIAAAFAFFAFAQPAASVSVAAFLLTLVASAFDRWLFYRL